MKQVTTMESIHTNRMSEYAHAEEGLAAGAGHPWLRAAEKQAVQMTRRVLGRVPTRGSRYLGHLSLSDTNSLDSSLLMRKISYGLLPAVMLVIVTIAMNLLIAPVLSAFGSPGLLVYTLGILAVGMIALERCVQMRYGETERAGFGIVAGLFLWFAVDSANRMEQIGLGIEVGLILLIVAGLIVWTLWKPVFPMGVKFFALVFLLNWAARFLIGLQVQLATDFPLFSWTYQITGFAGLVGVLFFMLWMLAQAESKIHHLWAAVGAWFSVLVLLIINLYILL